MRNIDWHNIQYYNLYEDLFNRTKEGELNLSEERINIENCSCTIIHEDIVNKVKDNILEEGILNNLSELFKLFGDTTRIKILCALFQAEMCVCDISAVLGMSQSAVSHQLRVLKQSRLVKNRKDGKVVYYSLSDDHIKHIFDEGLIHVIET